MANVGPLTDGIGSGVWGTTANFNGFRVLPSLLQRRRSPEANQTLVVFWAGKLYTFSGAFCHLRELCPVQYHVYVQVLRSPIAYWQRYCTALQQRASAKLCGVEQRARPIFNSMAITLGIGPHYSSFLPRLFSAVGYLMSTVLLHMVWPLVRI